MELYRGGQSQNFRSYFKFREWLNRIPRRHGLSAELVKSRYEKMNREPQIVALLNGMKVPAGDGTGELLLSGGWGQDFMFVPTFPLWQSVYANLDPLLDRMGEKLHLHPLLTQELFQSDFISLPDSAWAVTESGSGNEKTTASVKITYFDREMTPDGPWPRVTVSDAMAPDRFLLFRSPRDVPGHIAEEIATDYYRMNTSLAHWGLLPLENHTGYRLPEHLPSSYDPKYANLFSRQSMMRHLLEMGDVIDAFNTDTAGKKLGDLLEWRTQNFPPGSLEVAEIGRFNIPPGSGKAARAHLYYAASFLLMQRPIKSVCVLAPLPPDPNRPQNASPEYEVMFVTPGFEYLADLARAVSEEMHPTVPYESPLQHAGLRALYEKDFGFEVRATIPHVRGLPNGAHIMVNSRKDFVGRMVAYQKQHWDYFTAEQHRVIARIEEQLANE